MSTTKTLGQKVAGKAKQVVGEIIGDQRLHEEGKAEERNAHEQAEASNEDRVAPPPGPLGNLDHLT